MKTFQPMPKGWLANGAVFSCETCGMSELMAHLSFARLNADLHTIAQPSHVVTVKPRQLVVTAHDYIYPDGSIEPGDAS